jgi:hypothetical protein
MSNSVPVLPILYESGKIYGQTGAKKAARKIVYWLGKIHTLGLWSPGQNDEVNLSGWEVPNTGYVEGGFRSEFDVLDRRKYKGKEPSPSFVSKIAGNYIFPFFVGASHDDKKNLRYSRGNVSGGQEELFWEVDKKGFANHYLEKHCYYDLQVYGEDFAKLWGIDKGIGKNAGRYGFNWIVQFTGYVGWRMHLIILYGLHQEDLFFDCLLKEDLDPSDGGLAKWAAMSIGKLALGAVSAGASGLAEVASTAVQGAQNTVAAEGVNKAFDNITFRDWTGNPNDRDVPVNSSPSAKAKNDFAVDFFKAKEQMDNQDAWANMRNKTLSSIAGNVGKAFRSIPRTFFGGKASYSSSIAEFLFTKAHLPLLFLQAKTGKDYSDKWKAEMNRRLTAWDWWFGNDPEVCLKMDFGMARGIGYDSEKKTGVLKDLHGWIQLNENIIFKGKSNLFIENWVNEDIFVYQLRNSNKVYHRTKEDFFEGFNGNIEFSINRDGIQETKFSNRFEEVITRTLVHSSNTYAFAGFWCENGSIPIESKDGFTVGPPVESFKNYGGGYTGGGSGYLCKYEDGASRRTDLDWSNYSAFKGKPYQRIDFGMPDKPYKFGEGSGTVIVRYMKSDENEEEIYQSDNAAMTTWVLLKDTNRYKGGICLFKEIKEIRVIREKVETNFNGLNIQLTVPIEGFSGIEGWGNNPPSSFSGGNDGGGMPLNNPSWAQTLASGGMTLPDTNPLNTNQMQMPSQIQSMVNTEQVFNPLEMPQLDSLKGMMNMNQEYLQNSINNQENIHQSLHDKVSQGQKDGERQKNDPEKIKVS